MDSQMDSRLKCARPHRTPSGSLIKSDGPNDCCRSLWRNDIGNGGPILIKLGVNFFGLRIDPHDPTSL
jgi:hypothetical protein